MKYNVGTLREAGLEAKWSRNSRGAPIIVARNPNSTEEHQRKQWWYVGRDMWEAMKTQGIMEAFDGHTILGKYFSITV